MPEKGVNAIYKAAALVKNLESLNFDLAPHPFLGNPTLAVTMINAGTAINIIPDHAEVYVDIRTLPEQSEESVKRRLETVLGAEVRLRKIISAASVGTDVDNEWVQDVFRITENLSGKRPGAAGATYFTDCSILTPAYGNPPTVILGPGEPEMAHKTDEYCYRSKIDSAVDIYTEIAKHWCEI